MASRTSTVRCAPSLREHHRVAAPQRWDEMPRDERPEHVAAGATPHRHERPDPGEVHRADQGEHGPAVAWDAVDHALAEWAARPLPGHRDVRASFIYEDEPRRGERTPPRAELFAPRLDPRLHPLGGRKTLFLREYLSRLSPRPTVAKLTFTPVRAVYHDASSANVRSDF